MSAPATRHLTILLTDIKGFTDKTSHKSRAEIISMLDEHREAVLPILEGRGGTLIKTIGDAFLMTFESPTNAVLAGVAVQEALARRNAGRAAEDRLEIRIAINAGEVNLIENDVFGEAVNITARIEGIAEAGQVYFTEAVFLAMNKAEVPSSEVGLVQLKGIPQKIRIYKVRREEPVGEPPVPVPAWSAPKKAVLDARASSLSPGLRRGLAAAVDLLLCVLVAAAAAGGPRRVVSKRRVLLGTPAAAAARPQGLGDEIIAALKHGYRNARGQPQEPAYVTVDDVREEYPYRRAGVALALALLAYLSLLRFRPRDTPGARLAELIK